jgi:hypothetical protein
VKPTQFPEQNGTLSGGPGSVYGTEDDVQDLPVHRGEGMVISCWRPSLGDRLRLLFGGKVWLYVLTERTHAPVTLTTETPFKVQP